MFSTFSTKNIIYLATQLETRKFEVPVQIMHFTLWASWHCRLPFVYGVSLKIVRVVWSRN